MNSPPSLPAPQVVRLTNIESAQVEKLLARYGLQFVRVAEQDAIPGSYWGDDEAGLIGASLYARSDTPLHSILHEACHWITCAPERRAQLHTDAADTQDEENATCFLQIVLADQITGFGQARALQDMDAWGYSFRLGSARAWFEHDAHAELCWLIEYGLLDSDARASFCVRSRA